jgi:hypothetical protein
MRLDEGKLSAASDPAARARHGLSLVAFYRQAKPAPLRRLVEGALARLGSALAAFPGLLRPYALDQVHATILGLEGTRDGGTLHHLNAQARAHALGVPAPPLDLPALVEALRHGRWPIPIRFGGNHPGARNPYDPNRSPWERAFDVREDGLAVLIGWPPAFAPFLLDLRKSAERHGIVHKYHVDPAAQDNDLFLVLGGVDAGAFEALGDRRPAALEALARGRAEVRGWLARTPVEVGLHSEDLAIVEYRSTTLEEVSAEWPLSEVQPAEVLARYRAGG